MCCDEHKVLSFYLFVSLFLSMRHICLKVNYKTATNACFHLYCSEECELNEQETHTHTHMSKSEHVK